MQSSRLCCAPFGAGRDSRQSNDCNDVTNNLLIFNIIAKFWKKGYFFSAVASVRPGGANAAASSPRLPIDFGGRRRVRRHGSEAPARGGDAVRTERRDFFEWEPCPTFVRPDFSQIGFPQKQFSGAARTGGGGVSLQPVKPIRILIAEAGAEDGRAFAAVARAAPDLELVADTADGARLLNLARRERPDIVLLDLMTPGLDGLALLPRILRDSPKTQAIVAGQPRCEACLFDALYAGAQSYLSRDVGDGEALRVIRAVARGESPLPPLTVRRLIDELRRARGLARPGGANGFGDALTERENDIVRLILDGLGNKEIAGTLKLAEGTVKNYVSRILEKLNARSRTELAVKALNRRLY